MGEKRSDRFRVVIVGGGVAGLTLANALEVCPVLYPALGGFVFGAFVLTRH